jgi:hypothetical protein
VDGLLKDATRSPGRKPPTASKIKQVTNRTFNEKPRTVDVKLLMAFENVPCDAP